MLYLTVLLEYLIITVFIPTHHIHSPILHAIMNIMAPCESMHCIGVLIQCVELAYTTLWYIISYIVTLYTV